jgi:general secretion pathway protein G
MPFILQLGPLARNQRQGYPRSRRRSPAQDGFTLLELVVVVSIIMILATIAAGQYWRSVQKARETTLHTDLHVMRDAIQHYTGDKECGPQTLDDLKGNYIQDVPTDPMTGNKDWVTSNDGAYYDPDQTCTGISDVHSASDKLSPFENTPYSSW